MSYISFLEDFSGVVRLLGMSLPTFLPADCDVVGQFPIPVEHNVLQVQLANIILHRIEQAVNEALYEPVDDP